jgi:hypothetical protein
MKRIAAIAIAGCFAVLFGSSSFAADEFGTLSGKFVFKGTAPEMKKLVITKDQAFCGQKPPMDEQLIVGADGGIANVVIFAVADEKDADKPLSPIHPSYADKKGADVILDNAFCRFEPHVQTYWTEQKFVLKNSDSIGHNSYGQPFVNKQFNPMLPPNSTLSVDLSKGEKTPVKVTCSIHPWMAGYVIVRPDPYAAASAADGSFTIAHVPAGEHTFQIWHETLGYVKSVTIGGKSLSDRKGMHKMKIASGDNAVGDITIDAKDFARQLRKIK